MMLTFNQNTEKMLTILETQHAKLPGSHWGRNDASRAVHP